MKSPMKILVSPLSSGTCRAILNGKDTGQWLTIMPLTKCKSDCAQSGFATNACFWCSGWGRSAEEWELVHVQGVQKEFERILERVILCQFLADFGERHCFGKLRPCAKPPRFAFFEKNRKSLANLV